MTIPASLSRSLQSHLEKECDLYEKYLALIEKQRQTVTKFDTEQLTELDKKRKQLTDRMREMHEKRLFLMSQIPGAGERKLTDVVNDISAPKEIRTLKPIAARLKELVLKTREAASEFQGVQNFAMKIVNGSLALFAQATKHVSRQYGRNGAVNESYVPKRSRREGVIKEA